MFSVFRITALICAIAVGLAVIHVVLSKQQPQQWVTVRASAITSTGCGTFGNLTCHLLGTSEGRVYDVYDDSWVFVAVGHCYQLHNPRDNEAVDLHEVPC